MKILNPKMKTLGKMIKKEKKKKKMSNKTQQATENP